MQNKQLSVEQADTTLSVILTITVVIVVGAILIARDIYLEA